jgi:hypothetical protein
MRSNTPLIPAIEGSKLQTVPRVPSPARCRLAAMLPGLWDRAAATPQSRCARARQESIGNRAFL